MGANYGSLWSNYSFLKVRSTGVAKLFTHFHSISLEKHHDLFNGEFHGNINVSIEHQNNLKLNFAYLKSFGNMSILKPLVQFMAYIFSKNESIKTCTSYRKGNS